MVMVMVMMNVIVIVKPTLCDLPTTPTTVCPRALAIWTSMEPTPVQGEGDG